MPEVSVAGRDNRPGLLGKQQAMPHALALYQQQITMAHESSQEAKQQQPQPTKSQHYPGVGDSSSPRVRTRSPGVSDREREGKLLMFLIPHYPFIGSFSPFPSSAFSTTIVFLGWVNPTSSASSDVCVCAHVSGRVVVFLNAVKSVLVVNIVKKRWCIQSRPDHLDRQVVNNHQQQFTLLPDTCRSEMNAALVTGWCAH